MNTENNQPSASEEVQSGDARLIGGKVMIFTDGSWQPSSQLPDTTVEPIVRVMQEAQRTEHRRG
ncbi:hypothetical protein [Glycomyces sp. NPDC021274]|uniref:hypothetical protein n=1 Tax=Glycomyces sp. NPDC021274 TaxID=3155120 RepID=UPI0033CDB9E5